jgi:hypothetical protein
MIGIYLFTVSLIDSYKLATTEELMEEMQVWRFLERLKRLSAFSAPQSMGCVPVALPADRLIIGIRS